VLTFDFFFVPPRFSFTVDDAQYILVFIAMFAVALAISHLTGLMRKQTQTARLQERQAAAMHGLSRQLASARSVEKTLRIAVEYISEIFDSRVVVLLPDEDKKLKPGGGDPSRVFLKDVSKQLGIARKAFETGETVGWGTGKEPENEVLYAPIQAADLVLGVLALRPGDPERFLLQDQRYLLESLIKQVALSLEVEYLAERGVPLQSDRAAWKAVRTDSNSTLDN
jgi:two-component system sensor histidine kinase KdpD